MLSLEERVRTLRIKNADQLPLPGAGQTPRRHRALAEWGRTDMSLARIAEAHTDALAIVAEAGREARPGALYGVWASEGPNSRLIAQRQADGSWILDGTKQYCSGATFVTAALVTAHFGSDVLLFDVPINQRSTGEPGVSAQASTWESAAFADTATVPVVFAQLAADSASLLGRANWYTQRAGFWHGAVGPAACWAGGALSLVDAATALGRKDPHSRAQLGALQAAAWGLNALLEQAGREIDADPKDIAGIARVRALKVRHLIERMCTDILDRFGRATGPQLLAFDAQVARQHLSLGLYIRQCHAERDLEAIVS